MRPNHPTFNQWLTTYLDENEVMQTVFADQIGVSPQHLNDLVHGRRAPSRQLVQRVAKVTGISEDVLSVFADLCPPMLHTWDTMTIEYMLTPEAEAV